jgi:phosphonopyruvate decarboxylase
MGSITTRMLDLMDVPWAPFPAEAAAVEPALERALLHMRTEGRPYALVMSRGTVSPWPAPEPPKLRPPQLDLPRETTALERTASRADMIRAVRASAGPDDLLIASTGYTGRELLALGDTDQQLYMVGSMGCASSLALGLAMARPRQRVIVLDGDGAALMRLGALATIGHERPTNLVHVLLDNGRHESTGGQATVSSSVDFAGIAASCGYPRCERTATPSQLQVALERHRAEPSALTFLHAPIKIGVSSELPRPASSPAEKAARLRRALQQPAH